MTSSGKQLKKDKISLRNQLYEIKNSYGELISMEPVEWPPQWEEGLGYFRYLQRSKASRGSSVWGCGFSGGDRGHEGGGHTR